MRFVDNNSSYWFVEVAQIYNEVVKSSIKVVLGHPLEGCPFDVIPCITQWSMELALFLTPTFILPAMKAGIEPGNKFNKAMQSTMLCVLIKLCTILLLKINNVMTCVSQGWCHHTVLWSVSLSVSLPSPPPALLSSCWVLRKRGVKRVRRNLMLLMCCLLWHR